ncbi:MarR family winged helix-turn-helix transcriptional regulator [Nocardioides sp. URHA0032]|uniref:MarR family winged helix-turn-helix transcriptional regulator n=1 Tax=Nocardioides sp. URHA0032 TaxID=1380388 RepID=UPI000490A6DE|nr:MarR family transcriptional regulator [Nocardioides sp. URHA0032]
MATRTDRGTDRAARADLLTGLEQEVGAMVRRLRRIIRERAQGVHPDLQSSSYLMLSWLEQHGAQRASAMVESFGIDKGAISRQIQHLVELGLVERSPDPADGRATLVSITDDALVRMAAVNEKRRRWIDERLRDWSDDELTDIVALLGRYNAALDERD